MKYAVIYHSKSGNTKRVAEKIYESLIADDKVICDLGMNLPLPNADVYLIGFGVRYNGCSLEIINCLEQLTNGQIAFFATSGFSASEKYKVVLEKKLEVWLPENVEYLGMFLCRGRVAADDQTVIQEHMRIPADRLDRVFESAETHPDEEDLRRAAQFAQAVQRRVEDTPPSFI